MAQVEDYAGRFACEAVRYELASELKADHSISILPDLGPHKLPSQTDLPYPEPPKCDHKIKLGIVGAGMAGLYTALIIDELRAQNPPVLDHDIEYEILEASARMGGRCFTYKFSNETHDYYDPGAMRFPKDKLMDRFFHFCNFTGTKTITHYHSKGSVNCPMLFNGVHAIRDKDFNWESDPFKVSAELGVEKKDPSKILFEALKDYVEPLRADFKTGFKKLMEIDHMSTRDFLFKKFNDENKDFKDNTRAANLVQYLETFAGTSDLFTQSVSEQVFQLLDFHAEDWSCIDGGLEVLTNNAVAKLRNKPLLQKRVTKMELNKTDNGKVESMNVFVAGETTAREYNTVINTTTLGALSRIDLEGVDLNWGLRSAIRCCRYAPATKVAIKFKYPWWRTICGITSGGVGLTDNLLRWCIYPSYNINDDPTKPAVLLATYTWTHDAFRFGSLVTRDSPKGEEEIKRLVFRELAALHKLDYKTIADAYLDHHSYNWYQDEHASGACTSFTPGQFTELYPLLTRPVGRGLLHIAGEATSAHHGWVVGALESGYRAVHYFLSRYREKKALKKMAEIFGSLPELETGENGTCHLQLVIGCLPEGEQAKF